MNKRDLDRTRELADRIAIYQRDVGRLPSLTDPRRLDALISQFIDSLRRVEFANHIRDARIDPARADPVSEIFDPLRAAVLHNRRGNVDEAWWLVFLATHFGKHAKDGWRLARDVYGKLGQGGLWDWLAMSGDPLAFRAWLERSEHLLKGADGISRRFSNHRKYESLRAASTKGTAAVFASYVNWVSPPRSHSDMVRDIHRVSGQNPYDAFAALYKSMDSVQRFGRLGKFDFLAMLGKLGIAPISPGSTFLKGATGPLAGARLLFEGTENVPFSEGKLETKLIQFGQLTGLGSQVLEDALCNWHKSPDNYIYFKG